MACYQCKWNYKKACDDAKLDHPFIFYRIPVWSNKQNGQNKMSKGEPVITIKKKWIIPGCVLYANQHLLEPSFDRSLKWKMINDINKFTFHRYGSKTTDKQ